MSGPEIREARAVLLDRVLLFDTRLSAAYSPSQDLAAAGNSSEQESGIELAARPLKAFADRQLAALAGHAGERRAPLTAAVAMREMRVRAADATRTAWRAHAAGERAPCHRWSTQGSVSNKLPGSTSRD